MNSTAKRLEQTVNDIVSTEAADLSESKSVIVSTEVVDLGTGAGAGRICGYTRQPYFNIAESPGHIWLFAA